MKARHLKIIGVWLLGIAQIKWRCSSVLFGAEQRSGGLWAVSSAELLSCPLLNSTPEPTHTTGTQVKTLNGCNLITLFLWIKKKKKNSRSLLICVETRWDCFQWPQEAAVNVLYWNKNKERCDKFVPPSNDFSRSLQQAGARLKIIPEYWAEMSYKEMSRSWTIRLFAVVPKCEEGKRVTNERKKCSSYCERHIYNNVCRGQRVDVAQIWACRLSSSL